ncbi:hypothetical protein BDV24DRAFT_166708 [Aspergillus arachidicola]|uniref:Xylanolytic transcriptional activator regulatory domain-containing protein n=1 Tax=Aspergillus arachidicola TaxID=656916 RepID=A0A2G7FQ04_9EURO|nr:hypothetical protein BDV24DRAFT_166708 [Aspergillus arachidicola]PIG81881.1 hypothetical protein AARAC_003702 [Aspergillus arachidicola]
MQDLNSSLELRSSNSDSRIHSHDSVESPRRLPSAREVSAEAKNLSDMGYPLEEAQETREILEQELSSAHGLPASRRAILHSAVKILDEVLKSFPSASVNIPVDARAPASSASTHEPSFEFFYMMLEEAEKGTLWPDHVSNPCLRDMTYALIARNENEQLLCHYRVCVYTKAISVISRWLLSTETNTSIRSTLIESKSRYITAACRALDSIGFLSPPSLSLIQALLSGAMLMQEMGNVSQSWALTSVAARYLVALNGHKLANRPPQNERDRKLKVCLGWCFCLDTIMSMLLARRPSLPKLMTTSAELVVLPEIILGGGLMKTMVDLSLLIQAANETVTSTEVSQAIDLEGRYNVISEELKSMLAKIDSARHEASRAHRLDWIAVGFTARAALISIYQSRLKFTRKASTRMDCVACARESLGYFSRLQSELSDDTGLAETFTFQAWITPVFPLSSFLILFCNFIATSYIEDYALMEQVFQKLHILPNSKSRARIHHLIDSYLQLCQEILPSSIESHQRLQTEYVIPRSENHEPSNLQALDQVEWFERPEEHLSFDGVWGDESLQELLTAHSSLVLFEQDNKI